MVYCCHFFILFFLFADLILSLPSRFQGTGTSVNDQRSVGQLPLAWDILRSHMFVKRNSHKLKCHESFHGLCINTVETGRIWGEHSYCETCDIHGKEDDVKENWNLYLHILIPLCCCRWVSFLAKQETKDDGALSDARTRPDLRVYVH